MAAPTIQDLPVDATDESGQPANQFGAPYGLIINGTAEPQVNGFYFKVDEDGAVIAPLKSTLIKLLHQAQSANLPVFSVRGDQVARARVNAADHTLTPIGPAGFNSELEFSMKLPVATQFNLMDAYLGVGQPADKKSVGAKPGEIEQMLNRILSAAPTSKLTKIPSDQPLPLVKSTASPIAPSAVGLSSVPTPSVTTKAPEIDTTVSVESTEPTGTTAQPGSEIEATISPAGQPTEPGQPAVGAVQKPAVLPTSPAAEPSVYPTTPADTAGKAPSTTPETATPSAAAGREPFKPMPLPITPPGTDASLSPKPTVSPAKTTESAIPAGVERPARAKLGSALSRATESAAEPTESAGLSREPGAPPSITKPSQSDASKPASQPTVSDTAGRSSAVPPAMPISRGTDESSQNATTPTATGKKTGLTGAQSSEIPATENEVAEAVATDTATSDTSGSEPAPNQSNQPKTIPSPAKPVEEPVTQAPNIESDQTFMPSEEGYQPMSLPIAEAEQPTAGTLADQSVRPALSTAAELAPAADQGGEQAAEQQQIDWQKQMRQLRAEQMTRGKLGRGRGNTLQRAARKKGLDAVRGSKYMPDVSSAEAVAKQLSKRVWQMTQEGVEDAALSMVDFFIISGPVEIIVYLARWIGGKAMGGLTKSVPVPPGFNTGQDKVEIPLVPPYDAGDPLDYVRHIKFLIIGLITAILYSTIALLLWAITYPREAWNMMGSFIWQFITLFLDISKQFII